MYKRKDIKPFEKKIWLASPTMHGEELNWMTDAYNKNWMSTVGENINEVERIAAERHLLDVVLLKVTEFS